MSPFGRIALAAVIAAAASTPCFALTPIPNLGGPDSPPAKRAVPGYGLTALSSRLDGVSASPFRPAPTARGPMVTYDLTSAKGKNDHGAEDALWRTPGDPDANPFMAPLPDREPGGR